MNHSAGTLTYSYEMPVTHAPCHQLRAAAQHVTLLLFEAINCDDVIVIAVCRSFPKGL